MNRWEMKIDESKENLKELDAWIETIGWSNLPRGVRNIICAGQVAVQDEIPKYEEWVKEENQAE